MNIFIFRTSIEPQEIDTVNGILRTIIPQCTWNYDLEDCDNILRIESANNISELITFHLKENGFTCEELK